MLSGWRRWREGALKRRTNARWLAVPEFGRRAAEVLAFDPVVAGLDAAVTDPRSVPGAPEFRKSGWSEHMLCRYLLSLADAGGRTVLDSCCGLGWGSHLVAGAAARVVGVDLDAPSVAFCRNRWRDGNTAHVVGSVLELPFADESFDVVLCMEAIEHFTVDGARRYLGELGRVTRPGGVLWGSSAFPAGRGDADRLCARNPHHLHVFTLAEMRALVPSVFGELDLLTPHYFRAHKPTT
jgi:SAM-dependent methyltransferase